MPEYALIGYSLGHSRSAEYFNTKFAREGIDSRYINLPLADISELPKALAAHPKLAGFNVTAPYKQAVIPYLTRLSEAAADVDAVNTVKITASGELWGYNTDVEGFRESIRPMLAPRKHHKALVLGSGGAAKAVRRGLAELGIEGITVSRREGSGRITYADIDSRLLTEYDIIINATPLGTYPATDAAPPLDYSLITPGHICFDLVYNPPLTLFLRNAVTRGALIRNGLQMLLLQAEAAYRIWTGE